MPSINDILANEDFGQVVSSLCVDTIEYREPREYYKEYHGERRRRKTSVGWREPKRLAVYSETLKDKNGEPLRLEDKIVDVARIVTNFPKKEVRTSVAFLFGGQMTITGTDQNDGFQEFKRVWERRLKMQSVLKSFARKVPVSYTHLTLPTKRRQLVRCFLKVRLPLCSIRIHPKD